MSSSTDWSKVRITWSNDALASLENVSPCIDLSQFQEAAVQVSVSMREFEAAMRETQETIMRLFQVAETPDACSPDTSQPYPF